MDQSNGSVDWIDAYMEWTNADGWTFGPDRFVYDGFGEVGIDAGEEFAAACLDWMDAWQAPRKSGPHCDTPASDGIDADTSGLDALWDAFMVALHTDSDCLPFLRRIMDAGDATPRTVAPV